MARFSLNINICCLYIVWEKQDQIWAKIFSLPKNRPLIQLRKHSCRKNNSEAVKTVHRGECVLILAQIDKLY